MRSLHNLLFILTQKNFLNVFSKKFYELLLPHVAPAKCSRNRELLTSSHSSVSYHLHCLVFKDQRNGFAKQNVSQRRNCFMRQQNSFDIATNGAQLVVRVRMQWARQGHLFHQPPQHRYLGIEHKLSCGLRRNGPVRPFVSSTTTAPILRSIAQFIVWTPQ